MHVTMADTLRTALGNAILGFRQFSLRGISAAAGEWCLVYVAFTLTRFHPVSWAS